MPRLKVGAVHLSREEKGSGDPIPFVPGLIGLEAQWSHQVDHFSDTHRPVTFDHRAARHSDKPMQEYTRCASRRSCGPGGLQPHPRSVSHRFQNPCDGMRKARLKRDDAFSHAMIIVISAIVSSS